MVTDLLEPAFRMKVFRPQGHPLHGSLYEGREQEYNSGLCPAAESVQPKLLQFKTNYMDMGVAEGKVEALAKTIGYFGK